MLILKKKKTEKEKKKKKGLPESVKIVPMWRRGGIRISDARFQFLAMEEL
jgi:hypothetical protein